MSTIVTRAGKGSALTFDEVDANFNNLNTDKLQSGNTAAALTITSATINGGTVLSSTLTEPVRHSVRPSLLLDFSNTKQLDPRITFTRGSTATYYDGKTTVKAEENLLTYSQDCTNAAWVKAGTTVTGNSTTAPDGTTTANLITASAGASGHDCSQVNTTIPASTASTYSVYLKAGTYSFANVVVNGASSTGWYAITANLTLGTITQTGAGAIGTYTSSSITSVGNGWYRVTITGQMTQASNSVNIYLASSATPTYGGYGVDSWTAVGTETIYAWGAQLEQRSSVTAYTATTANPITNYIPALQTAASGVARFDHNPTTGESLGLLIEEQRTNVQLYSQDFTNAGWTKSNISLDSNVAVAPDGTLTASKIYATTSSTQHYLGSGSPSIVAANTTATLSMYVKAAGETKVSILTSGSTAFTATFNLTTAAITNIVGATASMTDVGNGWYRLAITVTPTAFYSSIYLVLNNPTTSYTGDGYSGVYVWGAQIEAGSFATSYIPTTSATVTRSADDASIQTVSGFINQAECTVYAESQSLSQVMPTGKFPILFNMVDASANTYLYQYGGGQSSEVYIGGTFNSLGATLTTFNKFAIAASISSAGAYGRNGTSGSLSGTLKGAITKVYIGSNNGGANNYLNGQIKKLAYYPKRLTNAELVSLTTI